MKTNTIYHIYNQSNGGEKLFREDENYRYFIRKIKYFILPVCDIYAFCLMPYHFHLLVKVKTSKDLRTLWFNHSSQNYPTSVVKRKISKSFANLFSCYALSYNKAYLRCGSLFRPNMKKQIITSAVKFKTIVHFIHSNPTIHKECSSLEAWKFSSYQYYLNSRKTWVRKDIVLQKFKGIKQFRQVHFSPLPCRLKIY